MKYTPQTSPDYEANWDARIRSQTVIDDSGCWLWTGQLTTNGYAQAYYRNKHVLLHRVAYERSHDVKVDSRTYVCHTCDVKTCINPDHLWLGSPKQNMEDKVRKGRHHEQMAERPPYKRDWKPKGLPPPAQRTRCPQGHPYSGDNLYVNPYDGRRECRACRREAVARIYRRKREHAA